MDDHRFDQLTRSIAQASNRRAFIKGLLALSGILGSAAALRKHDVEAARRGFSGPTWPTPTPTPPPCPAGQVRCGGACVDTLTDLANCGGCGIACGAGSTCQGGSCAACKPDISVCSAGSECCSGYCAVYGASGNQCETCSYTLCSGYECADTNVNDFHCGTCGNACTGGTHCWDGQCSNCIPHQYPGCAVNSDCCNPSDYCHSSGSCQSCAQTVCGDGLCVDVSSDPLHCGACNTSCGSGEYCYLGGCVTCTPPGYDCLTGSDCCSGTCISLGASGNMCE